MDLKVTYQLALPTAEQTERHLRLAQVIMGWPLVARQSASVTTDDAPHVYRDRHHGCLKGMPFPLSQGDKLVYDRSFQPWAPELDPWAANELRARLSTFDLGWEYVMQQATGQERYTCTLIPLRQIQPGVMASPVDGSGATPGEALVRAALKVADRLEDR